MKQKLHKHFKFKSKKTLYRFYQICFILLFSLSIGISLGQGCARPYQENHASSSSTPNNISATTPEYPINTDVATLGMVYNKQILDHLVSCSGVGAPSDETLATWNSKKGAVSIDGTILTITSPMLMAVTTIAGDVCRDLVEQEKTTPRLFAGINWSSSSLPSDAILSDAIRGLALSCWKRSEDDNEKQILLDSVKGAFTESSIDSSEALLFLCTSMLASLDTLVL